MSLIFLTNLIIIKTVVNSKNKLDNNSDAKMNSKPIRRLSLIANDSEVTSFLFSTAPVSPSTVNKI